MVAHTLCLKYKTSFSLIFMQDSGRTSNETKANPGAAETNGSEGVKPIDLCGLFLKRPGGPYARGCVGQAAGAPDGRHGLCPGSGAGGLRGGLALSPVVFGRRSDRGGQPLRTYGALGTFLAL
jgi:hypothetical protein